MNDKALRDAIDHTIGVLNHSSATLEQRNREMAQDIVDTKVRAASLLGRVRRLFGGR